MKGPTLTTMLFILAFPFLAEAQKSTIAAGEVMEKVRKGENVIYQNVRIRGDLDFTFYFEKKDLEKYSRKHRIWDQDNNGVEEIIESPISFVNCVFDDGVIGYIHDDYTGYTFTASFENDVNFVNCVFKQESAFKYSEFEGTAIFKLCVFEEEGLFKYSEFHRLADFSGSKFSEEANFKYAKFHDGLDFSDTEFNDLLNLKYAKIDGDFNSSAISVRDDMDTKYTEVNGRSFSKYLLQKND